MVCHSLSYYWKDTRIKGRLVLLIPIKASAKTFWKIPLCECYHVLIKVVLAGQQCCLNIKASPPDIGEQVS